MWCATRMTPSHSSLVHLALAILRRTRSTRISAPPPGTLSSPAARRRSSTCADREALEPRDVQDLLRRERVEAEPVLALHPAEEVLVPLDAQLGVEPALQEDLHAAGVDDLLQLLAEHLAREDVPLGVPERAVEGAEAAARRADVRVVDVAVDDVRDDAVRVLAAAHGVGGEAEVEERRFGEEALALGGAEALALGGARRGACRATARGSAARAGDRRRRSGRASRGRSPALRRLVVEALEARGARRRRGRSGSRRAGRRGATRGESPVRAACSSAMASRRSRPAALGVDEEPLVLRGRARPARPHHAAKTNGSPVHSQPRLAEVERRAGSGPRSRAPDRR